jgi:hypothetical protein
VITFHYNHGQSHYQIAETIAPDDQLWINLGDRIRTQIPDATGGKFPTELTTGTYDILQIKGVGNPSLFEGKIITDKTNGHLAYGCVSCCGYQAVAYDPNPFDGPVGGGTGNSILAEMTCENGWDDVTYAAYNWNSDNLPVAHVANAHTSLMSSGIANGFGSVNILWGNRLKACPYQLKTPSGLNNSRTVSQAPPTMSVSSGDSKSISVTIAGPAGNLSFTTSLQSNPNSSMIASVSVAGNSNASGTANYPISVNGLTSCPTNCPSGIFQSKACVGLACANPATIITIPPQNLIQMLYAEAHGQIAQGDASQASIGTCARNRINNVDFPGSTNWQNTVTSSQYSLSSQQNGSTPETTNAGGIFGNTTTDQVGGSTCFWSPRNTQQYPQWPNIQTALNSHTTTFPSNVAAPACYGGVPRQIVVKTSVANSNRGGGYAGAPACVFLRKRNSTDPAVVQIP